ncbi:MAG: pyrroloquinoline quinone biosynthesis peptide chaperone PqqD, partial [Thiohalocapsa sp.]
MTVSFGPEDVPVMARTFRLQWEEAQGSYVILYPEGMVKLNPAAGEILSRCDGERTVAAIIGELEHKFPDSDGLRDDVINFLSTAYEQQWIERGPI